VKENIMYSGHVHAMVGMYGVLFDDDKYEKPGSVVFRHDPVFWGMGPEVFEYSFSTLNDVIYWQMVENGWLGVACEPNCIFIVCNQFPMLGFRFHDLRKGTSIAAEAGESYRAAWADKGIFTSYGSFIFLLRQKQNEFLPGGPGSDAHAGAIMHAWNREFVRSLYPKQVHIGLRKGASGTVSPFPQSVLPQVFQAAAMGAATDHIEDRNYTWTTPDFGAIAMWLSELGDQQTLDALLKHADSYMNPSWDNHGLYYPRNDRNFDEQGRMTYVDPLIGNAMLAYARLNVPDGLWKLYNEPWSSAHFSEPCLKTVHTNVDVLRAAYLPDEAALVLTLRGRGGATVDADLVISNAPLGKHCDVYRDGSLVSDAIVAREVPIDTQTQQIQLQLSISKQTDLVLIWKSP
jgi:hypothetical protein